MKAELTIEQQNALESIIGGADVMHYSIAKRLREVQKIRPELIWICSRMFEYEAGEQLPYFGAIATKSGVEYLQQKKHEQEETKKPDV